MEHPEVFEFPCIFSLKAMGHNRDGFEDIVVEIVKQHAPESAINTSPKLSSNGNFRSITVTFVAESRAQLDDIYKDMGENPEILMAL